MSRILPIQPPHPFPPGVWKKDQEESLRRIWQDIAAFLRSQGGAGTGSGLIDATTFPGANAGEQMGNAIVSLPSTGGIIDARGFTGSQFITSNMFAGVTVPFTLLLGAAQFHVTVTQTLQGRHNCQILGVSGAGDTSTAGVMTTFIWDGAASGTVFFFDYCRDSFFEHFCIIPGTGTIGIATRIDDTVGGVSTNLNFNAINIGAATTGFQVGPTGGTGNDLMNFEDCYIEGAPTGTSYGYAILGGQSKWIRIHRGTVLNRTHGVYAPHNAIAIENVNFSSNVNDISLGNGDPVLIKSCQSETSNKFLHALGGTSGSFASPVTIEACRCATDNVAADNLYMEYHAAGPLNLTGNQFGDGTNRPLLKIDFQAAGGCRVNSKGNLWWDKDVFWGTPNDTVRDLVSMGDIATSASGDTIHMPTLIGDTINTGFRDMGLSNGANNDFPTIADGSSWHYVINYFSITGPTAAFSISGFTGGYMGRQLWIFNPTSQQMTIKNATGSSANNQILTLTGADVVLRAGNSFASFIYDATSHKWILKSTN